MASSGIEFGTIVARHHILRLHLDDKREIGDSLVVVAHLRKEQTAVETSHHISRVEAHGVVVVCHSAEIIIQAVFGKSAVDKIRGILRLEFDSAIEIGKSRLIFLIILHLNGGTQRKRIGVGLRERNRLIGIGKRSHSVAVLDVHLRPSNVTAVEIGIEAEKMLESGGSIVEALQFGERDSLVEQERLTLRELFKTLVVIGDSTLEGLEILASDAAHLVGIDDKRVALDGERSVSLGTRIILELQLSHGSVEIWFGKIGLGGNRLIEILD